MSGRALRVIWIKHDLDRALVRTGPGDSAGYALTGHIRQRLVQQLSRKGSAYTGKTGMEPFPGNALELSEQMQLGRFPGITEFVHQQMLRQVHEHRIFPNLLQMLKA